MIFFFWTSFASIRGPSPFRPAAAASVSSVLSVVQKIFCRILFALIRVIRGLRKPGFKELPKKFVKNQNNSLDTFAQT